MFAFASNMSRRAVLTTVATPTEVDPLFQPSDVSDPVLTQGEQRYIDKVKELEERYTKPKKRTKRNKSVKKVTKRKKKSVPKKKAFQLSQVIKGRHGVPITKATTLRSLMRHVKWGKKPLMELLNNRVRLVDDQFLNKRTTLLSLVRSMPMAKKPLVDVIVANKIL